MILRIELPKTNMAIAGALVVEWHKEIGDVIEYGDPLVDLMVKKVTRLQRESPTKVLKAARRRKARYFAVKSAGFGVRISSLDSGTLVAIETPEGDSLTEGTLLGTMSSQADSSAGSDHPETEAVARVVVNRTEATTEAADT